MQEDLSRKWTKWALLSRRFDFIRNKTNSIRLQSTIHELLTKMDDRGEREGSADPLSHLSVSRETRILHYLLGSISTMHQGWFITKSRDGVLPWIHGPTRCRVPPIKGPQTSSKNGSQLKRRIVL